MYPANLFNLFPPFPRDERVFVAMSFDERFDARWRDVIDPAIRSVGFEPYRVDTRTVCDSILTDIAKGIASSRLIFADITEIGRLKGEPAKPVYIVRNHNVFYEVGIAHATRLPEEVLLFRSDPERLPFDVASIRIKEYDPDGDVAAAKEVVASALTDAIKEVDLSRNLAVQAAADSLNFHSYVILQTIILQSFKPTPLVTIFNAIASSLENSSIDRLLSGGMITGGFRPDGDYSDVRFQSDVYAVLQEGFAYRATEFGKAVFRFHKVKMNADERLMDTYCRAIMRQHKATTQLPSSAAETSGDDWGGVQDAPGDFPEHL